MRVFVINKKLMGTAFSLGIVANNEETANYWLQMGVDEIKRIEEVLSEYKSSSVTSKINHYAGNAGVKINKEVFALLERSLAISKLTKGDFDITVSPLKALYKFRNSEFEMPPAALIKNTLKSVGYQKIILDKDTL
jgi:thiamine biosynthesis lipoprotein